MKNMITKPSLWIFLIFIGMAFFVGQKVSPTWSVERITRDVKVEDENGTFKYYYVIKGKKQYISNPTLMAEATLSVENIQKWNQEKQDPPINEEFVVEVKKVDDKETNVYYELKTKKHWGAWSLLPALIAIILCWLTKEPVSALFAGIITGALILGRFDITEQVLVPSFATDSAAGILLLYLCLLGALMGIWSCTGAAKAFAEFMTEKAVRGPRSAKFVAWLLGVIFFQGGTVSTVLVGTTVKPIADKENISHEELSYIVDSTASPIACILAFNAWPGYIQAFIYVSGVSFLATEQDRLAFFFKSIPFSFYAIFAVLGTFLLCIDKAPVLGKQMRAAIKRSRETGQLDSPIATPLSSKELETSETPEGYTPHIIDFFLPLIVLIGIAIGTFILYGSPEVRWAFGAAVLSAIILAAIRGMTINRLVMGMGEGFKGVVLGTVILLLAVTIGGISKEVGGGLYLVELLGNGLPYWSLPIILQALTMIIAFSTGTSWGTYAVAFPLAMPLAWAIAQSQGLADPMMYMMICFATVLNGSVFGDQCSPISDTTVLSAMCTGCDLMDHVKTQIIPAGFAAGLAAICWTACTFMCA